MRFFQPWVSPHAGYPDFGIAVERWEGVQYRKPECLMIRRLFRIAGALIACAVVATAAPAQNYPSRPVTWVVPFAPGGLTDVPARLAAIMLQQKIGQNIVVENRTGGSGVVGATSVARATPDGYTLLANSLADTQNIHYLPTTYSPVDDFEMIGWIVDGPALVLVIDANLPHKTLTELIDDAKANPKKFSVGTSGPASSPGLSLMQINLAAKTEIVSVPYRGSGEAARAVVGGAIQGAFTFFSQAKPLVDDGKLRPVGVAAPKRIEAWPDVPTFRELGYNIVSRGFVGLAAPAKTPKSVIQFWNKHLNDVVQSPAFKQKMTELGMAPPPASDNTAEKYDAFMREEVAHQGELAKLSGQALQTPQR
jgi:tripartite-type tricarboxylate transporter receptor subunit TctC